MSAALHCSAGLALTASLGSGSGSQKSEKSALLALFSPRRASCLCQLTNCRVFPRLLSSLVPLGGRDTALGALCIILHQGVS